MSWLAVVLALVAGLVGGCSSGAGSSMTGPSSQTNARPAGSDAAPGRGGSGTGGSQMM